MKNLEQVRAANALRAIKRIQEHDSKGKGDKGGDALTGLPALIVNNGLLATLAFSKSKSKTDKNTGEYKKSGHEVICDEIAVHLGWEDIKLLHGKHTADGLLAYLTNDDSDSMRLRLCTAETLAFLNYLRRFAKADKTDSTGGGK